MITALCDAVRRGVQVRLILPHIPDKIYAFALARTHYKYLISEGVEIYEYVPGFVHAKVFVSDDETAVVGTINMDYRSFQLHYENAVLLYHMPVIEDLLDPVYTGKAWTKFLMLVKEGYFDGQEHIAFVHTGGAAALFAMDLG